MPLFKILSILAASFVATSLAAQTAGCGKALPPSTSDPSKKTCVDSFLVPFTQSNGAKRSYRIHVPANYDKNKAVPLIFSFHGHNKTACGQEELSEFSNPAFNPNAFAIYPQGIEREWQSDPRSEGVDDLGFVQDMINEFSNLYCIDDTRIYAAGKSNGGGFTGTLACDANLSNKIAAFAPVSGGFYVLPASPDNCNPSKVTIPCHATRPIPIIEFHGGVDGTVNYTGGVQHKACLPTIPHYMQEWSKRDGLGTKNVTKLTHNGHVTKYEFGEDAGKLGLVTHWFIDDLEHDWPSTVPNGDDKTGHTYINATSIIMEFFGRYSL